MRLPWRYLTNIYTNNQLCIVINHSENKVLSTLNRPKNHFVDSPHSTQILWGSIYQRAEFLSRPECRAPGRNFGLEFVYLFHVSSCLILNDVTTRVNYSCFADTTLNTTIDEVTTTSSDVPTIKPPVSSGNDMQDQVMGGLTLLAMQIFTLSTWFQLKFHS